MWIRGCTFFDGEILDSLFSRFACSALLLIMKEIIENALLEDIGTGDITSNSTIDKNATASFVMRTREDIFVCGCEVAIAVFHAVDPDIKIQIINNDGKYIKEHEIILKGNGNARSILAAERVALNLMQQMSAVATLTRKFVKAIDGTNAKILDTRKTIPGLRNLQKIAVKTGGGENHRFGLYDAILIKDNHISVCGGIAKAINAVRENAPDGMVIEIECDTLEQVREALDAKADIILLDNMTNEQLCEAVELAKYTDTKLEASGGVTLDTVADIAKTGVDYISSGALTHSAGNVDIGLDVVVE